MEFTFPSASLQVASISWKGDCELTCHLIFVAATQEHPRDNHLALWSVGLMLVSTTGL